MTTVAGKGVVAETHPASLGASLPYAPTQELVAAADVVLAAGTELSETDIYTTTRLPMRGRLVRIDVDEGKLADHYDAAVRVHGDAAASRAAARWRSAPARGGWRGARRRRRRAARAHRARARQRNARAALRRAARAARWLPAEAVVFSDMTQIAYLGN